MTVARKFFSETVTINGNAAISLLSLMQSAGWTYEPGTNNAIGTTPSMDSTIGTGATIIPESFTLYVGNDQYVRDTASAGPPRTYRGVPVAAGDPYSIEEFSRGLVDANEIWLWMTQSAQSLQIIFKGI